LREVLELNVRKVLELSGEKLQNSMREGFKNQQGKVLELNGRKF
jgi:hypothetical protein